MQERRIRRRIDEAFRQSAAAGPTLRWRRGDHVGTHRADAFPGLLPENAPRARAGGRQRRRRLRAAARDPGSDRDRTSRSTSYAARRRAPLSRCRARVDGRARTRRSPIPTSSASSTLQPPKPVAGGCARRGPACAARTTAALVRRGAAPRLPWQLLKSDTVGEFSEVIACLLLANRAGAASRPLLESYIRHGRATSHRDCPSPFVAPDAAAEAARAEALDRICADLDVQIGLTLLKTGRGDDSPGRGCAGSPRPSGFRLADGGRFDWVQEETGAVLYSLQNYRSEPFTADTLRTMSTPGAVLRARRSARSPSRCASTTR